MLNACCFDVLPFSFKMMIDQVIALDFIAISWIIKPDSVHVHVSEINESYMAFVVEDVIFSY